ncbi:MAG: hypothetical protein AAGJ81_08915 [Verrucomicrobiota bacterium]
MLTYPRPLYYLKPFPEEELERIAGIDWLNRIGQKDSIKDAINVQDRDEAISMAMSDDWTDFRLEMRNEVTGFLSSRHSQNYTEWNNSARALRGFFDVHIAPKVEGRISDLNLGSKLIEAIGWDIVTALQEIAFSQFRIPRFHDRLLEVYQNGHLPCGITPLSLNEPNPNGTLHYY